MSYAGHISKTLRTDSTLRQSLESKMISVKEGPRPSTARITCADRNNPSHVNAIQHAINFLESYGFTLTSASANSQDVIVAGTATTPRHLRAQVAVAARNRATTSRGSVPVQREAPRRNRPTVIQAAHYRETEDKLFNNPIVADMARGLLSVPRDQLAHDSGTPRFEFMQRANVEFQKRGGKPIGHIGAVATALLRHYDALTKR